MRVTAGPAAFVALFVFCQLSLALPIAVKPTTTLSAETSPNTSASSTFSAQSNGNIAPANVSKVDSHTLLYAGATTKIYAHYMGWFGPSNHMNVGYSSADPGQIQRQVDDQVSRGIDGAVIDWYGPTHYPDDNSVQLMISYAQTLVGTPFKVAVMEDGGALSSCSSTSGCDLNKTLVSHLTYIYNTYEGSPAYMRLNEQPAVFFFGVEKYAINWDYVKANVPGNPAFIFENAGGFIHADGAGGFSWVQINSSNPNDWQQSYLDNFYQAALNNPFQQSFGVAFTGFNDTMAAWSAKRVVNQNCGQTWLATWNEIGKYYSGSNQIEQMQIVTWNDYEEGTEIETGIENCVSISASAAGNTLSWAISGNENTIDRYEVFVSVDGHNLMPVMNATRGVRTADISAMGLAPGAYTFYVKAVGKPSMTNKMSNAVNYSVTGGGSNVASGGVALHIAPPTATIREGQSAQFAITATADQDFNGTVTFNCDTLPKGVTCNFSPATLNPKGASPVVTTLTVWTPPQSAALTAPAGPARGSNGIALWASLCGVGLFGCVVVGKTHPPCGKGAAPHGKDLKGKVAACGLAVLTIAMAVAMSACGGGSSQNPTATPLGASAVQVTVTATSATTGGATSAQQMAVTINVQ